MSGGAGEDGIMFVLQDLKRARPIEFDGHVHFTWLGEESVFDIEWPAGAVTGTPFLELRLGYPEKDRDKRITASGAVVEGGAVSLPVERGWTSYFIPLRGGRGGGGGPVTLTVNKPLDAPGDDRFLGVMLSYGAVTDDVRRIDEIRRVSRAVNEGLDACRDVEHERWNERLRERFIADGDDFYTANVQPSPTARVLEDPVESLSVRYKRERWIAGKVEGPGVLLDVGCGHGGLTALKKKGVDLIGLDLSFENCATARGRGYDLCIKGSAVELPLRDSSVDYLVSLDVLGHIPAELKGRMIDEFHRVLRPGGLCLHLIETDRFVPSEMDPADYMRMVVVDGHVGIEERAKSEALFAARFEIVESFLVGNVCMSLEHWVRAHDLYGANLPGELVAFFLNASERERRFFDIGAGWTFWKLVDEGYDSKSSGGLLFLHARKPFEG
ncbi:MAG TPA: class I SAM-dependent methyltransferase [Deltaproteobacteria bacterium]|nr:class I SAM-dependent methyltransferase [Deltaproteobacteria bacterium]